MGQSDRSESLDIPFEVSEQETAASAQVIAESTPFIGQWNRLISTTNWEKGQIIFLWRQELKAGGFTPAAFSDETWSQIVGGVTPQHVGRLRRTWEQFGDVYSTYQGIFWSHFYAALDWNDAELWLEGAVQNRWSVSQMRTKRWESLGQPAGQEPQDREIISAETDEEAAAMAPRELASRELDTEAATRQNDPNFQSEPRDEGPDFGDSMEAGVSSADGEWVSMESPESLPPARLFESFRNLPEDLAEATSAFKLAIVRHKTEGWEEISQAEVLRLLDALKMFAQLRTAEEKKPASKPEMEEVDEAG
jgi:hypothetical protein